MKMDRRNSIGKRILNSVKETPMLVMMRIWIYLLTKGYIHTITSLPLTSSGISNYHQKRHFPAISPRVILKMMSMKGHRRYGHILV